MSLFEAIADVLWEVSWRLFLCLVVGGGIAFYLHSRFPGETWTWFVSVPLVLGSILLGCIWHSRARDG